MQHGAKWYHIQLINDIYVVLTQCLFPIVSLFCPFTYVVLLLVFLHVVEIQVINTNLNKDMMIQGRALQFHKAQAFITWPAV